MPEIIGGSEDPGTSLVGAEPVVQDDTLELEPDEGETSDAGVETTESDQTQEAAAGTETETQEGESGKEPKAEGAEQEVDWQARAEKYERIAREHQSRHDQLVRQIQPHAARLAEMIRADQEKAERLSKNRDELLREFANDPSGVIKTLVNAELGAVRSQEQMYAVQAEAQGAMNELVEYAVERGVDQDNLALLLAPYNNFAGMAPKQALSLAKVLVDGKAAPNVDAKRVQEAIKDADQRVKQKLIKKVPAGTAGGAAQSKEKSADDQFWDRIANAGSRNPLKSLR